MIKRFFKRRQHTRIGIGSQVDLARKRQKRLLELFQSIISAKGTIVPISAVDEKVAQQTSAYFLKHDVHDLSLGNLIDFASEEINLGISATYFFLPKDHPRIAKAYKYEEQIEAMHQIKALGHELALHIDPYFLMHERGVGLADALADALYDFRQNGIEFKIGNLHGNSQFKLLDINGYGTSFDLFEEIGRQPDFPKLADVSEQYAEIIRKNRVSLAEFGLSHWADMPLWSAGIGFVGTNYLTDNNLAKKGSVEVLMRGATTGCYYISKTQPPGYRNLAADGQTISTRECHQEYDSNSSQSFNFFSEDLMKLLSGPNGAQPLLMLIHPEFYC